MSTAPNNYLGAETMTNAQNDADRIYFGHLRTCLASPGWLKTRGTAAGDIAGETLADTFRRELAAIEGILANEFDINLAVDVVNVGPTYVAPVVGPSTF